MQQRLKCNAQMVVENPPPDYYFFTVILIVLVTFPTVIVSVYTPGLANFKAGNANEPLLDVVTLPSEIFVPLGSDTEELTFVPFATAGNESWNGAFADTATALVVDLFGVVSTILI